MREAGGGPWEQFLAALAGGVGGGMAANKIGNVVESELGRVRYLALFLVTGWFSSAIAYSLSASHC